MQLISREDAKAAGLVQFFTGQPCRAGHMRPRYVSSGRCYECQRLRVNEDYRKHGARVRAERKKSYRKHRVANTLRAQKWVERNREKSNSIKKAWKLRNREKYLKKERDRERTKCAVNPMHRLSCRVSKAIWAFFKGGKAGRKWSELVGYDLEQLKQRVESLFSGTMTWENYGKVWELDHIRPKSWFTGYPTPEDAVRAAWALTNLQPLLISKNRSKCNRYEG